MTKAQEITKLYASALSDLNTANEIFKGHLEGGRYRFTPEELKEIDAYLGELNREIVRGDIIESKFRSVAVTLNPEAVTIKNGVI